MGRESHWSTPGPCPTRSGGGGGEGNAGVCLVGYV